MRSGIANSWITGVNNGEVEFTIFIINARIKAQIG